MNEMPWVILNYTWIVCISAISLTIVSKALAKDWKKIIRKWKEVKDGCK